MVIVCTSTIVILLSAEYYNSNSMAKVTVTPLHIDANLKCAGILPALISYICGTLFLLILCGLYNQSLQYQHDSHRELYSHWSPSNETNILSRVYHAFISTQLVDPNTSAQDYGLDNGILSVGLTNCNINMLMDNMSSIVDALDSRYRSTLVVLPTEMCSQPHCNPVDLIHKSSSRSDPFVYEKELIYSYLTDNTFCISDSSTCQHRYKSLRHRASQLQKHFTHSNSDASYEVNIILGVEGQNTIERNYQGLLSKLCSDAGTALSSLSDMRIRCWISPIKLNWKQYYQYQHPNSNHLEILNSTSSTLAAVLPVDKIISDPTLLSILQPYETNAITILLYAPETADTVPEKVKDEFNASISSLMFIHDEGSVLTANAFRISLHKQSVISLAPGEPAAKEFREDEDLLRTFVGKQICRSLRQHIFSPISSSGTEMIAEFVVNSTSLLTESGPTCFATSDIMLWRLFRSRVKYEWSRGKLQAMYRYIQETHRGNEISLDFILEFNRLVEAAEAIRNPSDSNAPRSLLSPARLYREVMILSESRQLIPTMGFPLEQNFAIFGPFWVPLLVPILRALAVLAKQIRATR